MGIPVVYRRNRSRNIESFDAFDIATGRGLKIFYAGTTTANEFLSDTIFTSNDLKTQHPVGGTATNTTIAIQQELDFDIEFETPAIMDGRAICNLTFGGNSGGVGNKEIYVIATAKHVDGATNETDLDNETSDKITFTTSDNSEHSLEVALALDITNQKFKIGDKFRLNIQVWGKTSANDYRSGLAHDPANRNDPDTSSLKIIEDAHDTILKIQVPFKVKL